VLTRAGGIAILLGDKQGAEGPGSRCESGTVPPLCPRSEPSKFWLLFVTTAGTEDGYVRLGMPGELAGTIGVRCLRLEVPRADSLVELIERRGVA
jgi:hypothetical protein